MTDFFVSLLGMFEGWIYKLPELSIDSAYYTNIRNALATVVDFIKQVNFIVPIDTILLILSIVYGFRLVKFAVFVINWVVRRIADFIP